MSEYSVIVLTAGGAEPSFVHLSIAFETALVSERSKLGLTVTDWSGSYHGFLRSFSECGVVLKSCVNIRDRVKGSSEA